MNNSVKNETQSVSLEAWRCRKIASLALGAIIALIQVILLFEEECRVNGVK